MGKHRGWLWLFGLDIRSAVINYEGLVRPRKCSFIAILKVVGLGGNICSCRSFHILGRAK